LIDFPSIRPGYQSVLALPAGVGQDWTIVYQGVKQNLCQSVGSLFPPGFGAGRKGPGAFCTRVKEGKHFKTVFGFQFSVFGKKLAEK
jgi:hypothetical protein